MERAAIHVPGLDVAPVDADRHRMDVDRACRDPGRLQDVARVEAAIAGSYAAFDRVTRMLGRLLGAPVAAFTLVDDHAELVASAVGHPVGRTGPEAAIFCRTAVTLDDALYVDDATRDARFADEPLVTGADGLRFYAGAPVRTPDGRPVGTLCAAGPEPRVLDEDERGLLGDLRDSIEELIALRLAEQRLQALNADLETFASTAAHDLKGPLASVAMLADLLRDEGCTPQEAEELLGRIATNAVRMTQLVNDLLDLAHAEGPLAPVAVPLGAVVAEVAADLREPERPRVDGDLPTVHGDPVQVRQLVANLIGNARKYHAAGASPDVQVSAVAEATGWTVRIDDRGIGLPADPEVLFAPFRRDAAAIDYAGTGLGLTICRRIVERHGGRIGAEPRDGGGSRFWFWLPGVPAAAGGLPTA